MKRVAVIGGGIAGIAAALTAARGGAEVALHEANLRLGGRLKSFTDSKTGWTFNIGEHLVTAGYTSTLELLDWLGAKDAVEIQDNLEIPFYVPQKGRHVFKASRRKAPYNLLSAIWNFDLLPFAAKIRLIIHSRRLLKEDNRDFIQKFRGAVDFENAEVKYFWTPFIISAMNALPAEADWMTAGKALQEGFLQPGGLGFFKRPLSEVFDTNASKAVLQAGIKVHLRPFIGTARWENNKLISLDEDIGRKILADYYIFALPPEALNKAFAGNTSVLGHSLSGFSYSPICGVHLVFKHKIFPGRFGCLPDSLPQWFFEAGWNKMGAEGQGYSLVISAADKFISPETDVVSVCLQDLGRCGADFKESDLLFSKRIWSKMATVKLTPEFAARRPKMRTSLSNVFLAGDWIDTGLPATIESAVRSGMAAGKAVFET